MAEAAARLDAAINGLEDQVAEELLALAVEIGRQVARSEL
jgi:flagellar biosynthesis/type III secretory pathway protein FliH